jgi:hypothetical protein
VGLQAHVKKKPSKPRKSTTNPKAHPIAPVFALANMSIDHGLVNVASFSGMEDANVAANKTAIHTTQRQENHKRQGVFQREVKESIPTSRIPLTKIPTDAKGEIVGLRAMWQQAIKDATYAHLNLTIRQFKLHTQKQWDAIHNDLAK